MWFSEKILSSQIVFIIIFSIAASHVISSSASDIGHNKAAEALLKWKASLEIKSQSLLSSWAAGSTPCKWMGITCDMSESIIHLNLSGYGLRGTLHNLNFSTLSSNLRSLDLHSNRISDSVPQEIGTLRSLDYLDLSKNNLTGLLPASFGNLTKLGILYMNGNKFSGSIPEQIAQLSSLKKLYLQRNQLNGFIPAALGNMRNLYRLRLFGNRLSGSIPRELGMLRSLEYFDVSRNNLTGSIPSSFGNLRNLAILYLEDNELSGFIPSSLGNLTSLTRLSLKHNHFNGSIPATLGNLGYLSFLNLGENQLSGTIPNTIGNLSKLTELRLYENQLFGSIPTELGKLELLKYLVLFTNKLSGSVSLNMNNFTHLEAILISSNQFIGSLPEICLNGLLVNFAVFENHFTGSIPKGLKNCSSLVRLRLEHNHLKGNISKDFGIYPHLEYMDLSYNELHGELSWKWDRFSNLLSVKISNNELSGMIPPEIGQSTIQLLDVSSNHLRGEIPEELGRSESLMTLLLEHNNLTGMIPDNFGMLFNLEHLNLAGNSLSGSIPEKLCQSPRLWYLDLSKNKFREHIPTQIENLEFLCFLDLSQNLLKGEIPQQLGKLKVLEILNLSHNNFSGSIPSSFDKMISLTSIDLSYNQLAGPIPENKAFQVASSEAFRSNKGLCGNASGLQACLTETDSKQSSMHYMIYISVFLGTIFLLFVFFKVSVILRRRPRGEDSTPSEEQNQNLFSIWSYDGKLVYESIIEATNEFDDKYCIGVGGYGTVYKAEMSNGQVLAVKKLHPLQDGKQDKSFESEIRALTEIRHRNIVKLLGFCSHPRHSLLVYEFLEGGSIEKILRNEEEAVKFDWLKRVDVVKGMAKALSYIHHDCSAPMIHRDISSKNVLLNSEYVAHISDFGTARLMMIDSSNWTSFAGTFGYTAPGMYVDMYICVNYVNVCMCLCIRRWRIGTYVHRLADNNLSYLQSMILYIGIAYL